MLGLLLSLVAASFCAAALLSVEVTVRAPGALRAPNGLRSVESVLAGAVTEVLVRAGDEVAAGQVVARLEETQLRASLTLRAREYETLKQDTAAAAAADAALLEQTTAAVEHQRSALGRRSSIHRAQLEQRSGQLDRLREARRHGYGGRTALASTGLPGEGAGGTLFLVFDAVLHTTPASASVLTGITRDPIVKLARDAGIGGGRARPPARTRTCATSC